MTNADPGTGIAGMEYVIDLAVCDQWLVTTMPTDAPARVLASSH